MTDVAGRKGADRMTGSTGTVTTPKIAVVFYSATGNVAALAEKKTWRGWCAEVGGNLAVNIVTIFVIGALVLGYKSLGEFNASTEKRVGLGSEDATQGAKPNAERPVSPSLSGASAAHAASGG